MKPRASYLALGALALAALACTLSGAGGGDVALGDYVWHDANGDGIQQDEEAGVPGVTVKLYTGDRKTEVASTTTDNNGAYGFSGVEAGEYRLFFDPPEGFEFTQKDKGDDDALDSDAYQSGPDEGWTDPFEVGAAADNSRDAGVQPSAAFVETPTPTPLGKIGDDFPTVTPQPEQQVRVRIGVLVDDAGHLRFVALPEETDLPVLRQGDQITLVFEGENPANTCIELTGTVGPDGAFVAEGIGTVAGFPGIHGTFEGMIGYDSEGVAGFRGELTLGDDGKLPQGKPITYEVMLLP